MTLSTCCERRALPRYAALFGSAGVGKGPEYDQKRKPGSISTCYLGNPNRSRGRTMEDWKNGRLEGWKAGGMEGWRDGRMKGFIHPSILPLFHPSTLPSFHPS